MSILKGERLADLISGKISGEDPLLISPTPDVDAISASGSASIDLRLGVWFTSLLPARLPVLKAGSFERTITKSHYVGFGNAYYLHPRSFVLG
ncbi:MAG: hypothetical protein ACRD8U_06185, partial [Pyrinomonadaceae bacterium]